MSDPDAVGVAVQDGAVTLGGHAPTYAGRADGTARPGSRRHYAFRGSARTGQRRTGPAADSLIRGRARWQDPWLAEDCEQYRMQ